MHSIIIPSFGEVATLRAWDAEARAGQMDSEQKSNWAIKFGTVNII